MQRLATSGFRLVKNLEPKPPASYEVVRLDKRNFAAATPVSDDAFAVLRSLYRYDAQPLNVKVEAREDTPDWRHETVSIDPAYGGERILVHLYLPRSSPRLTRRSSSPRAATRG